MHTWVLGKVASLFIYTGKFPSVPVSCSGCSGLMCVYFLWLWNWHWVLYWLLSYCYDKTQWYKAPHRRKFILVGRSKRIRFYHGGQKEWLMAGAELVSSNTNWKQRGWIGNQRGDLNSQSLPPATYSSSNDVPSNPLEQWHQLETKNSNVWAYGGHSHSNHQRCTPCHLLPSTEQYPARSSRWSWYTIEESPQHPCPVPRKSASASAPIKCSAL